MVLLSIPLHVVNHQDLLDDNAMLFLPLLLLLLLPVLLLQVRSL
jgi:hypothetical protein